MICPNCGTSNNDQARFCGSCGFNFRVSAPNRDKPADNPYTAPAVPSAAFSARAPVEYAGFWRRFAAYIIDAIILSIGALVIDIPFVFILMANGLSTSFANSFYNNPAKALTLLVMYGIYVFIILILWVLYFAKMESSTRQATLGKIALGIKVTDLNGDRISFSNAVGRYFSKFLSVFILYIGFFMIAFTGKKQGLHDLIAKTLVIMKNSEVIPGNIANPVTPAYAYPDQQNNSPADISFPANVAPPTRIVSSTVVYRGSKFILPDGGSIILSEATKGFGRSDFEKNTSPSILNMISRQHFFIKYENGKYFINDYSSANGTKINGIDIQGKGWQELKDGDMIDVANAVSITFKRE